jgi:outer membrane protein insertion porin family
VAALRDKYGGVGHVFADVKADPRFLEEPGTLDLVYKIKEGDPYTVGKIDVAIQGEYPHTKITTILNRMSLKPGDIVDIREIRASERRIKASQLFENNPATGGAPKIVYSPPEKENDEEEKPTAIARRPKPPKGEGQTPESNRGAWNSPPNASPGQRDGRYELAYNDGSPAENRQGEMIVRGQYTPDAGRSTPAVFQRPMWGGTRPAATTAVSATTAATNSGPASTQYPYMQPVSSDYNAYQGNPPSAQQGYAQQGYPQQGYSQPAGAATSNPQYAAQPIDETNANQYSAAQAAPPQYPPVYSGQPCPRPGEFPYNAAGALPPPERPVGAIIPYDSPFTALPSETGDPTRPLPLTVTAQETQTGRFMFGVGINSDAGLFGSIVIDEQNFDLFRFPRGWDDIANFTAWRGAGQRLRIEAVPGTQVQRYMVTFQEPYLFDSAVGLSLSGYYYSRSFLEYFEERVGGRAALGYQFSPDLSGSIAYRGARVNISHIIDASIPALAEVEGNNALHGFAISLAHDTRDNPFLATEGHLIEASIEEVIGSFQYPHAEIDLRRHFTMHERPDGSGRHVLSLSGRAGYTGDDTPIYERYYAGGFSTIRGFTFRGVSPTEFGTLTHQNVFVGGNFELLASAEYMFPITADDMLRGVVFCDTGTVEPTISNWTNTYRVSPGFGLRILVPAMGPAPIAFDFAFPVSWNHGDKFEMFSFFVGFGR